MFNIQDLLTKNFHSESSEKIIKSIRKHLTFFDPQKKGQDKKEFLNFFSECAIKGYSLKTCLLYKTYLSLYFKQKHENYRLPVSNYEVQKIFKTCQKLVNECKRSKEDGRDNVDLFDENGKRYSIPVSRIEDQIKQRKRTVIDSEKIENIANYAETNMNLIFESVPKLYDYTDNFLTNSMNDIKEKTITPQEIQKKFSISKRRIELLLLITVLSKTGKRFSEFHRLTMKQLDELLFHNQIEKIGKTGTIDFFITGEMNTLLTSYKKIMCLPNQKLLFTSSKKELYSEYHSLYYSLFKTVPEKGSVFHQYRNMFALKNSGNPSTQFWLNHSNPTMTSYYETKAIKTDKRQLLKNFEKL